MFSQSDGQRNPALRLDLWFKVKLGQPKGDIPEITQYAAVEEDLGKKVAGLKLGTSKDYFAAESPLYKVSPEFEPLEVSRGDVEISPFIFLLI